MRVVQQPVFIAHVSIICTNEVLGIEVEGGASTILPSPALSASFLAFEEGFAALERVAAPEGAGRSCLGGCRDGGSRSGRGFCCGASGVIERNGESH